MVYAVFSPGSKFFLETYSLSYATAHDAAASNWTTRSVICAVRNSVISGAIYRIQRAVSRYNTSTIGAATISAARIAMRITTPFATADGDQHHIHLVQGNQSEPVVAADYGSLVTQTTSGGQTISTDLTTTDADGTVAYMELNATGLAWINAAGYTSLAMRTEGDILNQTPTGLNEPQGITYAPVTDFTMHVITAAATEITLTSAVLHGYCAGAGLLEVEHDGIAPTYPRWRFNYGKAVEGYTLNTGWQTGLRAIPTDVTATITGLDTNTTYQFRIEREDTGGTAYGLQATFNTLAGSVYPSEAITRVTNIIHRYSKEGQVYTMELNLGGVTSELGIPEWADRPMYAITPKTEAPAPPNLFEPHVPDVPVSVPVPTPTPIPGQIVCPYCGETFNSYLDYSLHYLLYHSFGGIW